MIFSAIVSLDTSRSSRRELTFNRIFRHELEDKNFLVLPISMTTSDGLAVSVSPMQQHAMSRSPVDPDAG